MLNPILNKEMKNLSSMKTGGIARECYFPENEGEIVEIIKNLRQNGQKYIILGNISNVLLPDEDIEVPLIVTTEMRNVAVNGTEIYAEAGVSVTKLAIDMCKMGLSGLETFYGIPGSVGGAVYMNAGAYGGETANVIKNVKALDSNGNVVTLTKDECEFDYRKSLFQKGEYIILGANLVLEKKNADECVAQAKEYMQKRVDKQPLEYPSCGSAFKRPTGCFAGALIEGAGLKGYNIGGAEISQKHAGFVINKKSATTGSVITLMRDVREKIFAKDGVMLEAEIQLLNKDGEFFTL